MIHRIIRVYQKKYFINFYIQFLFLFFLYKKIFLTIGENGIKCWHSKYMNIKSSTFSQIVFSPTSQFSFCCVSKNRIQYIQLERTFRAWAYCRSRTKLTPYHRDLSGVLKIFKCHSQQTFPPKKVEKIKSWRNKTEIK